MQIKQIELVDWGKHKHIVHSANDSVIGILGTNGSGKSTIIRALCFAFTGALDKKNRKKYIRHHGSESGAKTASVSVTFVHESTTYHIYRKIGDRSENKLSWNDTTLTKVKDIDEKIADILGASKRALATTVFPVQGALTELVDAKSGDMRKTTLIKLLGLDFLKTRETAIKNKITALSQTVVDYRPTLQLLEEQKRELSQEIDKQKAVIVEFTQAKEEAENFSQYQTLTTRVIGLKSLITQSSQDLSHAEINVKEKFEKASELLGMSVSSIDSWYGQIAAMEEEEAALYRELYRAEDLESGKAMQESLQAKIVTRQEEQKQVLRERAVLKALLVGKHSTENLRQFLYISRNLVEGTRELEVVNANICSQTQTIDKLRGELTAHKAQENEMEVCRLEQVNRQKLCTLSKEKLAMITMVLNSHHDMTSCPMCEQHVAPGLFSESSKTALIADIAKLEEEIRQLGSKQETYRNQLDSLQRELQYALAHKEVQEKRKSELEGYLKTCREQLPENELNWEEELNNVAALEQKIADLDTRKTTLAVEITNLQNTVNSINAQEEFTPSEELRPKYLEQKEKVVTLRNQTQFLLAANAAVESYTKTKQDAEKELETISEAYEAITEKVAHLNLADPELQAVLFNNRSILDSTEMMLRNLQEQEAVLQLKIKETKQSIEAARTTLETIDDLKRAQQLLGKQGLADEYLNAIWDNMVEDVQDYLKYVDANFVVRADPDKSLSFQFTQDDFPENLWLDQDQLSGGQEVRLAIALLLSIQKRITPEVGLLVLDEPSNHLDATGVDSLNELLMSLTTQLKNEGAQVIVCDHNQVITASISSVLQL